MRHLVSVVLALVLAPVSYVCAGFAVVWFAEATARGDTDVVKGVLGAAAALLAGALYAVLVMARLSPVGPIVVGLSYLGLTGWAITDPTGFQSMMPSGLLGVNGVLRAAVPFGTSLMAVPLLATVFSPRRWRRGAPATLGYDGTPAYPPTPGSAAPTYSTSGVAAPSYAPTSSYLPRGYDGEEPTARDAPSLTTTSPLYQPPNYPESAPSFPGFITPSSPPDDDPHRRP